MTKLFTKLCSTFLNCDLCRTLWGCRGSCIGICFLFVLLYVRMKDFKCKKWEQNKNWMKEREEKVLLSTSITKLTVEEDTIEYKEMNKCLTKAF